MAERQRHRRNALLDHETDVTELGQIATALRMIASTGENLGAAETAAIHFLACLAAERTGRLAAAMDRGCAS